MMMGCFEKKSNSYSLEIQYTLVKEERRVGNLNSIMAGTFSWRINSCLLI